MRAAKPRLELADLGAPGATHPDRELLERIADPFARLVFEVRIQRCEREGCDSTLQSPGRRGGH